MVDEFCVYFGLYLLCDYIVVDEILVVVWVYVGVYVGFCLYKVFGGKGFYCFV